MKYAHHLLSTTKKSWKYCLQALACYPLFSLSSILMKSYQYTVTRFSILKLLNSCLLNTHTNQGSNIRNIKMLSQQLQLLTSRIGLEKQKGDMLESASFRVKQFPFTGEISTVSPVTFNKVAFICLPFCG